MIFIVIPVFNRLALTKSCLDSVFKLDISDYKVIVVDHGSTDGTSTFILSEYPQVFLVEGDESMWWAAATNEGVKAALKLSSSDEDLVLTLNNDLEVSCDYLTQLIKLSHQHSPCIVGSVSVNIDAPESICFAGVRWNKLTAKFRKPAEIKLTHSQLIERCSYIPTDLLPGRGTLIPIKAFRDLGLFDEKVFPHYIADEEFSLRCSKNGYKLLVSTKGVVRSHVKSTGINVAENPQLATLLKSLFSIRSANNLKCRYQFAKRHTPFPLGYFAIDLGRVLYSFIRVKC